MIELKCPFCGEINQTVEEMEAHQFQVNCPDCGAFGPVGFTENKAMKEWNIRVK